MKTYLIYIITLAHLYSCSAQAEKNENTMLNIFKKKQKRTEILSHTDYNFIFENNIVEDIPIEVLNIGNINLPTGKVVVCDPLVVPDMPPLSKSVSPGKYPIRIYIAKTQESGDRYAIAKLEFSDKKAVK